MTHAVWWWLLVWDRWVSLTLLGVVELGEKVWSVWNCSLVRCAKLELSDHTDKMLTIRS